MAETHDSLFEPVGNLLEELMVDDLLTPPNFAALLPDAERSSLTSNAKAGIAAGDWVVNSMNEKLATMPPVARTLTAILLGGAAVIYSRRVTGKGADFLASFGLRVLRAAVP